MVNVHASGGRSMMEAARRAADESASKGNARPLVIAVTVLTSLNSADLQAIGVTATPLDQAVRLAELARAAGLDGVVASPQETSAIRAACGPDFTIVTPGIRGGGAASSPDDQQRTLTPAQAVAAGSSYLVVGRPITGAPNPREAARQINKEAR
jgi:orotidine-5'-phosphate decarboxylase